MARRDETGDRGAPRGRGPRRPKRQGPASPREAGRSAEAGAPSPARRAATGPGPDPDVDLIYGLHAALAALANPRRRVLAVRATKAASERLPGSAPVTIVTPDEIEARLPQGAVHQGVVVEARPLPERGVPDLAGAARVAVLDQITDPHNVGAILRSAALFGIEAVITTERRAPALTGLVAKTASGALEQVPVIRVTNLARALDHLGRMGFFRIGLAGETRQDLGPALEGAGRVALVLGAEGPGLRRLTRERCDVLARIPMPGAAAGAVGSLNVSNAAAIAFYLTAREAERADG